MHPLQVRLSFFLSLLSLTRASHPRLKYQRKAPLSEFSNFYLRIFLSNMASGIMIETCTFKIIFLSAILWVNAASECYFPNKALARRDTPCYADGRVSHCCSPNAICLTNQLCLSVSQPFSLSRGSCTDQDWGSDCPSICGKRSCSEDERVPKSTDS